jgi:hypothetical protein
MVHALPMPRQRRNWIVRAEGVRDICLGSESAALDYARRLSRSLANRYRQAVVLRVWRRDEGYVDHLVQPDPLARCGVREFGRLLAA